MRHALCHLGRDALTLVAHHDNTRLLELGIINIFALEEGALDARILVRREPRGEISIMYAHA